MCSEVLEAAHRTLFGHTAQVTLKPWLVIAIVSTGLLVWLASRWNVTPAPKPADAEPELQQPAAAAEANHAPQTREMAETPARKRPSPESVTAASDTPATDPAKRIQAPKRSGPVDELAQQFEDEARGSAARSVEAKIEGPFRRPEVPPGVLESVVCHTTVCRIRSRWSPDHAQGFMSAIMQTVRQREAGELIFDAQLGVTPDEPNRPDGSRDVTVYLEILAQ
jgi:hypothetical protein